MGDIPPPRPADISSAQGPEFDFGDAVVVASEAKLREAALRLQVSLERTLEAARADLGEHQTLEAAYPALSAALEAAMPPFYSDYDAYVAAVIATGRPGVSCAKGCGNCCSHYVTSVEPFEVVFLHARVSKDAGYPDHLFGFHRRAVLFSTLLDGGSDDEAEDRALFRYHTRNVPCPFLSPSGGCGIYASRPISCRMFFSLSHPSLCRGKATASPANRNFHIELPEDIEAALARAGAMLAELSLPESLFQGLLEANERFGRFDGQRIRPSSPRQTPINPSA